ncbi:MAG: antitoxin component YwqK of YwqJK toxin-antitoxin module, partial [Litorivivens sp.]
MFMRKILTLVLICSSLTCFAQKQQFVDFYEDGQKMTEGFYERGVEHGVWKSYYQNGELR